jgi:ElaB/YqjD/DUF883 family membrane-anchored ribosome-binding protein
MNAEQIKKELLQISADLDRLTVSNESGASWESAGHLRNRSNGVIRRIARRAQTLSDDIVVPTEPVLRVTSES